MIPALLLALAGLAHGADDFIKLQRKAEERREPAERAEWFGRAISAWTSEHGSALLAHCHMRRGEAWVELKDDARALPDLDKAVELDPRSATAYFVRGRLHLRHGRAKQAVRDLAEYAGLTPEDIDGLLALGEAQRRAGQWDAAAATYLRVAQLEPRDYRAALGRGQALIGARKWGDAELALDQAARLSKSREPDVFIERAVVRVALKRNPEAVDDYSTALPLLEERLEAGLPESYVRAARAYYGRGRLTGSVADYEAACRLGHERACALIPKKQAKPEKPKPLPKPPKPRKIKIANPDDEPGDRIYAQ